MTAAETRQGAKAVGSSGHDGPELLGCSALLCPNVNGASAWCGVAGLRGTHDARSMSDAGLGVIRGLPLHCQVAGGHCLRLRDERVVVEDVIAPRSAASPCAFGAGLVKRRFKTLWRKQTSVAVADTVAGSDLRFRVEQVAVSDSARVVVAQLV